MDLFADQIDSNIQIAAGAYWLRGFALPQADAITALLDGHLEQHPLQKMMTPMGYPMSVRTTSFGRLGWVGTIEGYGYAAIDVATQRAWPPIPRDLLDLAKQAASHAGYADFVPDTCLINVYEVGAKMGLHQDKDEHDFSQPIVSVSLGLPVIFQFGGSARSDKPAKVPLMHGDVVVWGGESRLFFHGVLTLKKGKHPLLGQRRINLTFRKAGKM